MMKNPLQHYKGDKIFWFRLFGVGLKFAKTPMLFSERYGYTKCWKVFGWKVLWLPKLPEWKSLIDYSEINDAAYILGVDPCKSESDSVSIWDGSSFMWQELDEKGYWEIEKKGRRDGHLNEHYDKQIKGINERMRPVQKESDEERIYRLQIHCNLINQLIAKKKDENN